METKSIEQSCDIQVTAQAEYAIQIGMEDMTLTPYVVKDPIVTARQILAKGGFKQPSLHLVFQWLDDGELQEMRLDQSVDLRVRGTERFLVFKSERSYRFELNELRIEWGAKHISGAALKKLADVNPDTHGVWQEMKDSPDVEVEKHQRVDLDGVGLERFVTAIKTVTIQVNDLPVLFDIHVVTGARIKDQAIAQNVPIQPTYQLLLKRVGHPSKVIGDDEQIAIHNGMIFRAIPADDNS